MIVISTEIPEVLSISPQVFRDERGFFLESFNRRVFCEKTGVDYDFVQDNHSRSVKNVLRGLHYQIQNPQGKLISVFAGEVFDVAVDIRKHSPTFGKWTGRYLSSKNQQQLWIPPGFAHGFLVVSERADVLYKTTNYYDPQYERSIRWDDPDLAIDWNLKVPPILSAKDNEAPLLRDAEVYS